MKQSPGSVAGGFQCQPCAGVVHSMLRDMFALRAESEKHKSDRHPVNSEAAERLPALMAYCRREQLRALSGLGLATLPPG